MGILLMVLDQSKNSSDLKFLQVHHAELSSAEWFHWSDNCMYLSFKGGINPHM